MTQSNEMNNNENTISLSENTAINALLHKVVGNVRDFAEEKIGHIQELVDVGIALTAEKNLDRLLELILEEAMRFTNADGGTLYIKDDSGENLKFTNIKNIPLNLHMGGNGLPINWLPVPLYLPDGSENHHNVSAHAALTGKSVNISDVYDAQGFDFSGTQEFDQRSGYRSRSMLVIPLSDHENEVIGVLQLLNARDRQHKEVVVFPAEEVKIITSLASLAATALTNVRLIDGLENLLQAFVQSIATAIDEKSPYTKGHIERVAVLSERIAMAINDDNNGIFADVSFSQTELSELRLAAWLHDVGKICTPEWVLDKSVKLEAVLDRMELIRYRLEIRRQHKEIERLRRALGETVSQPTEQLEDGPDESAWYDLLRQINSGECFLDKDLLDKLVEVAETTYLFEDIELPLVTNDELKNLSVRRGTLNDEERKLINNHVVMTIKMLENLPFPKKFSKVPLIAGLHHERLNGNGYPAGLLADQIPLAARILAIADTFEALTASDRPYKPGKHLSLSMRILEAMTDEGHLDGNLCDFLVQKGIFDDYASTFLPAWQVDNFNWRGSTYQVDTKIQQ